MCKAQTKIFAMRLPLDLYDAVKQAAQDDRRSIAGWLRERALEHPAVKAHMIKQRDMRVNLEQRRMLGKRS